MSEENPLDPKQLQSEQPKPPNKPPVKLPLKGKKEKEKELEPAPPPDLLFPWRSYLLRCGQFSAILAFIAMCICWAEPFPALSVGVNGYEVNPWDLHFFTAGLLCSLLTSACALLGRGSGRRLLFMTGFVLFVLSVLGFISNHI